MKGLYKFNSVLHFVAYVGMALCKGSGPFFTILALCLLISTFVGAMPIKFFIFAQVALLIAGLCNIFMNILVSRAVSVARRGDLLMDQLNSMLLYMRANGRMIKAEVLKTDDIDKITQLSQEAKDWEAAEQSLAKVIKFMSQPASIREYLVED